MGCMLRSDPMTQCDVFLQPEAAFQILSRLGEVGCVQFYDLNENVNAFQRTYVLEICRYAEMERKLRYVGEKMREEEIYIPKLLTDPNALELHETPAYEATIDTWERIIMEMSANLLSMTKTYQEMLEMSYVLESIGQLLGDADVRRTAGLKKIVGKGGVAAAEESGLVVITGLVQSQRSYSFQLMLWRLSRGNVYYKQTGEDRIFNDVAGKSGAYVRKVAFLMVVQGEELGDRMKKVCDGFRCDLYPLPPSPGERMTTFPQLTKRIDDISMVLKESKYHRCKEMRGMARLYPTYLMQVKKAKAIYHIMNYFTLDITKKCLIGRCWVPTADLPEVQDIFHKYSEKLETSVPSFLSKVESADTPPTFHRTNKFTYGFQALISAYGDSKYRELNPGLYTIITFPFLFSLMFGDWGHGTIMFCTAAWMLINEKKFIAQRSDSEIWNIFFGGRYIMLLMSLFSIYAGFIYNDCFSKSFSYYTSGWSCSFNLDKLTEKHSFLLEPKDHSYAYAFGEDPMWEFFHAGLGEKEKHNYNAPAAYFPGHTVKLAENKILFENSLKMKLSIIIGVIHMLFGLSLNLFNHTYFHQPYLIFLEFLPQAMFLICIFMWLVFLMLFKWFKYGGASPSSVKESQGCAPLVLILFIDMVLVSTTKPVAPECDAYMFGPQQLIQQVLLCLAMVSVPIMLLGPPCYAAQHNKKKRAALMKFGNLNNIESKLFLKNEGIFSSRIYVCVLFDNIAANKKKIPDEENNPVEYATWKIHMEHVSESFGDMMIHQSVHTIEFVLSTISHTASYLRLWALSLAHAQLSEMLWTMVFSKMALRDHTIAGGFKIVVVFGIWAFFTLAILVLMEGLSAFLHTLRLHWVEFMSKFFVGGGSVFKPFSFEVLFSDSSKDKLEVCPAPKVFEY